MLLVESTWLVKSVRENFNMSIVEEGISILSD